MLYKASRAQFLYKESEMWAMEDLVSSGMIAENSINKPQLGVKQRSWWSFIPLTNYVSPLLHCEIGIGKGSTKRTLCGIILFKLNTFLVMFLHVPSIDSTCFPRT